MAKLTKEEKDRFRAERQPDFRRKLYRKPSLRALQRDAAAAEKSRLWCLAHLSLSSGDAKDVL